MPLHVIDTKQHFPVYRDQDGCHVAKGYHRLHLCSLDLSDSGKQRAGGLGLSIRSLPISVAVELSERDDVWPTAFAPDILPLLEELRSRMGLPGNWKIRVQEPIHRHKGLGSTTQVLTLTAAACAAAAGHSLSMRDIIPLPILDVGSNVGLTLCLSPGVILDFGFDVRLAAPGPYDGVHRRVPGTVRRVRESAVQILPARPLGFVVAIPTVEGMSGAAEEEFWSARLPISLSKVSEACYHVLMDLLPALESGDADGIRRALAALALLPSKADEIAAQPLLVGQVLEAMTSIFGFAGLSSVGPACYSVLRGSAGSARLRELRERLGPAVVVHEFSCGGQR